MDILLRMLRLQKRDAGHGLSNNQQGGRNFAGRERVFAVREHRLYERQKVFTVGGNRCSREAKKHKKITGRLGHYGPALSETAE
ncbi:hypothetical protein [Teredinibacter turnerae]|uniref:hypothetical protein n=1 Tax=Teredinibacter turnerae TaxID=2426 RepID=UPI00048AD60A|nr:hypothetical protein [Teredinibacter turnerae]